MHALAAGSSGGSAALGFLFLFLGFAAYWTPALIAWIRRVPNAGSVTVLNVFGFTIVCWIIALAMAVRSIPKAAAP